VCHQSIFWGLEVKRSIWEVYYKRTRELKLKDRTVLQYEHLKRIYSAGGGGVFVYPENLEEVLAHIRDAAPILSQLVIY